MITDSDLIGHLRRRAVGFEHGSVMLKEAADRLEELSANAYDYGMVRDKYDAEVQRSRGLQIRVNELAEQLALHTNANPSSSERTIVAPQGAPQ